MKLQKQASPAPDSRGIFRRLCGVSVKLLTHSVVNDYVIQLADVSYRYWT